jgi:hypothetical protein
MRALRLGLIALGALVYGLVFGELFLRWLAPQPLVPRYVTGSPDGVRANLPNVTFRQWTPEVDVTVHYNDKGMRDDRPAPPLAKAPGECRVALLGDSYFVGFESDYASSFPHQLELALAAQGMPARVLDFAVSGFGTAEMLVTLRSRAAPWRPDLVVMSWHASDPNDNLRANLFRLEDGRLVATGQTFLPGVEISDRLMHVPGYRWAIENSHLYSAIRERAGTFVKGLMASIRGKQVADAEENNLVGAALPALPDPADQLLPERPPGLGDIRLDRALVMASAAAAGQIGANFLLFDVPTASDRLRMSSALPLLGPLPGIVTASPLPEFEAAAGPDVKLYYERGHHHWTPLGNALAARAAAHAIVEQKLLKDCTVSPPPLPVGG